MTFREYVFAARTGPNARGDFIRDARDDNAMPDDFKSVGERVRISNGSTSPAPGQSKERGPPGGHFGRDRGGNHDPA